MLYDKDYDFMSIINTIEQGESHIVKALRANYKVKLSIGIRDNENSGFRGMHNEVFNRYPVMMFEVMQKHTHTYSIKAK